MGKKRKTRELTSEEKGMILAYHDDGWSVRAIGKRLNVGKSTVQDILAKKQETGTTDNKQRSGRPRATTESQEKYIRVATLMDRFRPSHDIARNMLNIKSQKPLSSQTVRRRQAEAGLNGRIARNKPKLTKKQRRARMKWARQYQDWTAEEWDKVYWSDESPFYLFVKGGKVWVRRRVWEEYALCCIQPTVKFGGGHINVWGCFSSQGVGSLHQIHGIMTGAMYREILKNHMAPGLRLLGPGFKFQHDNDPKHTSKVVKNYLSNQHFSVLEWPSQSPDLNPIENLWARMKQRLRKLTVTPSSLDEVFEVVKLEWELLDKDYLVNLVHSMPNRIKEVIKNKGGPTRY
jgi:transposase